ncbi:MAG: hypothetical protein RLZZ139_2343 [Cyanobacteriota bacterium]|jgi:hypothetical protein
MEFSKTSLCVHIFNRANASKYSKSNRHHGCKSNAKRWAIKTLFGCFKSRGFCLESTHLQDSERLSKLITLLTLALCWAFASGLWLAQLYPLNPKKHSRLPKSIFRLGFDFLRHFIFDLHLNSECFFNSIKFLSCT